MKHTTVRFIAFASLLICASLLAFGQATVSSNWSTTTLSVAPTASATQVVLGTACTSVPAFTLGYAQGGPGQPTAAQQTMLYVDRELMRVTSTTSAGTSTCLTSVERGVQGTKPTAHIASQTVWIGAPSWFISAPPGLRAQLAGACPTGGLAHYPLINTADGSFVSCDASNNYNTRTDSFFYVPPSQCTFAPTTLTTTNTYPQVGGSNVFVLNGTTNAATGTLTLTCNILLPSRSFAGKGASIWDITTFVGSQTTAPSAVGTATLGTITFPAAATTETASTVTPVAAGGTVTTVSPTALTSVTTAGAFLTLKSTFSTAVVLNTDRQILQYTVPFTNGSAAVMTLNTPGLLVHYTADSIN